MDSRSCGVTAQSLFIVASGLGAGSGMVAAGQFYAIGRGPLAFTVAACCAAVGALLSLAIAHASDRDKLKLERASPDSA